MKTHDKFWTSSPAGNVKMGVVTGTKISYLGLLAFKLDFRKVLHA